MLDKRNSWDSAPHYPRDLIATGQNEFGRLAVLDTSHVRTGLHYQLKNKRPPAMISLAETGAIGLLMELETLTETINRLPRFSEQFAVDKIELIEILNRYWLPHIRIVRLPQDLRGLAGVSWLARDDPRLSQVCRGICAAVV